MGKLGKKPFNNYFTYERTYILQGHEFDGYKSIGDTDYCFNNNGTGDMDLVKEFTTVVQDNGISPAEDYFNGKVLGLNKDYEGKEKFALTLADKKEQAKYS